MAHISKEISILFVDSKFRLKFKNQVQINRDVLHFLYV